MSGPHTEQKFQFGLPMPITQLRAELHCHTVYSYDGHIEFDGLVMAAQRLRLDVICITDHDTIEGAREFQRRCSVRKTDLQIVVGEEKTLEDGAHVIGLFLKEPVASDTFEDAVREIREQGGLCTLPHPFRHRDGLLQRTALPVADVAGFEVFNPKCSLEENEKAHALCDSGLVALGGSDAHYESDLGQCVNLIPRFGNLRESLDEFLQGRVPYQVLGIRQRHGEAGRQYAPFYYRMKPYVRVPRSLLPAAHKLYRVYRNSTSRWKTPQLEIKYASN
jgi:predicted metal-dependent phosphoesterase TrpH